MRSAADERPILVVCGLAAEARIAAGEGILTLAAPPAALRNKLEAFDGDVSAVVSFGLAGGLAESLKAGTLIVSERVLAGGGEWRCEPSAVDRLCETLRNAGLDAIAGTTVCRNAPVSTARDKAALRRETGAVAVDTESHLAAAFAERRGVPFVAIRAICDTAETDLPPLAVRAIGADGRLDWRAIGVELGGRPKQLLQLPGTALATLRAMRTLRRVRRLLGLRFGL